MEIEQEQTYGYFDILGQIRTSQNQNGLKHKDFRRYRNYCTVKVKKIRKQMNYNHSKKYQNIDYLNEYKDDQRLLQVLLFKSQKDWAYSQELKQQVSNQKDDQSKRPLMHAKKKLKKAMFWAEQLKSICIQKTFQKTQQEIDIYTLQLEAQLLQDRGYFYKSLIKYIQTRKLYQQIISSYDSFSAVALQESIELIEENIRFNYQQMGGSMLKTIKDILTEFQSNDSQQQSQQQQKQQEHQVSYLSVSYPIKNIKVQQIYQQVKLNHIKIQDLIDNSNQQSMQRHFDNCLKVYIEIFSQIDDILRITNQNINDQKNTQTEKEVYQKVYDYFNLLKLNSTLKRNQVQIKTFLNKFDWESNWQILLTKKQQLSQQVKPIDIIKFCDTIQQNLKQIMEIERANTNLLEFRKLEGLYTYYRAIRTIFISMIYCQNNKFIEAISLFEYTKGLFKIAKNQFQEVQDCSYNKSIELYNENIIICQNKVKLFYSDYLVKQDSQLNQEMNELSLNNKTVTQKSLQTLIENYELNNDIQVNQKQFENVQILEVPVKLNPIAPKPIFYDLAFNAMQYPNFSQRIEKEEKGWFKKLNFFGK